MAVRKTVCSYLDDVISGKWASVNLARGGKGLYPIYWVSRTDLGNVIQESLPRKVGAQKVRDCRDGR